MYNALRIIHFLGMLNNHTASRSAPGAVFTITKQVRTFYGWVGKQLWYWESCGVFIL